MDSRFRILTKSLALTFAVGLAGPSAFAATAVWDGGAGGTGTELGTAANWTGDALPVNSDILQWDGTAAGNLSLTYSVIQAASFNTAPGISINVTSGQTSSLAITGTQTLRLNGSGITIASGSGAFTLGTAGVTAFNGAMALTNNSSNTATLSSGIAFGTTSAGATNFQFGGSGNWVVNSNLASTNNPAVGTSTNIVTKAGSGTLTLGAANTYVGGTTINAGTLALAGVGALSSTGAVTVSGSGAVFDISGISAASTTIGSLAGGTGSSVALGGKALTVGGTGTGIFAGNISGAGGSLVKQGTGLLALSGTNAYTGVTTVSAGTLALLTTSAKSASTSINVASGATFALGVAGAGAFTASDVSALLSNTLTGVTLDAAALSGIDTSSGSASLSGALSGSRLLTKTGVNYILTLSGANSTTGGTTISSGALQFANPASMSATGTVTASANTTLAVNAGGVGEFTNATSGAGSIGGILAGVGGQGAVVTLDAASSVGIDTSNAVGNVSYAGAFNKGLLKLGTGTLELTNGGTYSGNGAAGFPLVVRQGTLLLNGGAHTTTGEIVVGGTFGTANGATGYDAKLQIDSGSLTTTNYLSVGRGNGIGTVSSDLVLNNAATVTVGNFSAGYNGGNAANLPKGTITLNGTSSFTSNGVTVIAESTGSNMSAVVNTGTTLTSLGDLVVGAGGAGSLTLNSGTITVTNATERWLILGRDAGGSGTLTINGGTVTLNANTDLRMGTTVNNAGTNVATLNGGSITGGVTSQLDLHQAANAGSNNTFNLNGGTLTINQVVTVSDTGTAAFNFNGGTLKANGAQAAFFALGGATQRTNVRNGGAIIDTNTFNVTISEALLHSNVGGDNAIDGGLSKLGAGTLTLSGVNTYTGNTTVSAGTLSLASTGTLLFTINNNGTANQLVNSGAAVTLDGKFNLNLSGAIASNTWTLVSGAVTYNGTFSVVDSATSTAFTNAAGVWSYTNGAGNWSFAQSSGQLSFTAVPEPHEYAVLIGGMLAMVIVLRRRRLVLQ